MRHLHFNVRLLSIFFAALLSTQTAISGERFSIGISGGAALTDLMDQVSGGSSEAKRYTVGPVLEIRLPASFAAEISALYRRTGFTSEYRMISVVTSRVRANSWEFPVLVKYYTARQGVVARPYISGGYVLRFLSNAQESEYMIPAPGYPPTTHNGEYWPKSNPSQGMAIGGGISFKAGPIRIAPEIRYTAWFTVPFDAYDPHGFAVKSAENQVDLLVSVTF